MSVRLLRALKEPVALGLLQAMALIAVPQLLAAARPRITSVAIQLALREARRSSDNNTAIRRFSMLATSAEALGDYQTALIAVDELIRLGQADDIPPNMTAELALLLDKRGQFLWHLGRLEDAADVSDQVLRLRLAEAEGADSDPTQLAISLDHLGVKLLTLGRASEACDLHSRSVNILREHFQSSPDCFSIMRHAIYFRNRSARAVRRPPRPDRIYQDVLEDLMHRIGSAADEFKVTFEPRSEIPDVIVTGLGQSGFGFAIAAAETAHALGATVQLLGSAVETADALRLTFDDMARRLIVIAVPDTVASLPEAELTALAEVVELSSRLDLKILRVGNRMAGHYVPKLQPEHLSVILRATELVSADSPEKFIAEVTRHIQFSIAITAGEVQSTGPSSKLSARAKDRLRESLLLGPLGDGSWRSGGAREAQLHLSEMAVEDTWVEYLLIGLAYLDTSHFDEAERELFEALQAVSAEFVGRCLVALAQAQLKRGRLTECLASLRAATGTTEAHQAYVMLGRALASRGWVTDAIAAMDSAIALRPDRAESYFWRAQALFRAGRITEADDSYSSACIRDPFYAIPASRAIAFGNPLLEWRGRRRPFRFREWSPELAPTALPKPAEMGPPVEDGRMRVGVVLAGGGGKGAYQAGVLSALDSVKGLEVVAVSGASIGALNAAAYSSKGARATIDLWRSLTPGSVLKVSAKSLRILPALAVIAAMYISELVTYNLPWALLIARYGLRHRWATDVLKFTALPWTFGRLIGVWLRIDAEILRHQAAVLSSFSLSPTHGVEELIDDRLLAGWAPRIPTYCAIADYRRTFNPDSPFFHQFYIYGWYSELSALSCGIVGFVPRYIDLAASHMASVKDSLLRSSALPFVFPSVGRKGAYYSVDGGVLDNAPIVPLINLGLDGILVVLLKSRGRAAVDPERLAAEYRDRLLLETPTGTLFETWEKWARRSGRPQLRDENYLASEEFRHESTRRNARDRRLIRTKSVPDRTGTPLAPTREMPALPPILILEPTKYLGGLIRGTLNFRERKVSALIDMGFADGFEAGDELLTLRGRAFEPLPADEVGASRAWFRVIAKVTVAAFQSLSPRQYVGWPTEMSRRRLPRS